MEKVVIIRYAEIHLKGKNRGFFEHAFAVNLEKSLKGIKHELRRTSGRYLVEKFDAELCEEVCARIANVFGVHSYSVGYLVESDMNSIFETALLVAPDTGTFKVGAIKNIRKLQWKSMRKSANVFWMRVQRSK